MRDKRSGYKPKAVTDYLISHKVITCIIIIILYLAICSFLMYTQGYDLEKSYYISQIIGGIFIVGGLLVSVLQYVATSVDNKVVRENEKVVKAAELAHNFQKDIVPLSGILSRSYAQSSYLKETLQKIQDSELILFEKEEVLKIVPDADTKKLYNELQLGYLKSEYVRQGINVESLKKIADFKKDEQVNAYNTVRECVVNLANILEYFSICFNSGIADEDTVYQSLHQVFFGCVGMLYPFIFLKNVKECDRYYSNLSVLYIKWNSKHIELEKREEEELTESKKQMREKIGVKKTRH